MIFRDRGIEAMWQKLKNIVLVAIVAIAGWFLLTHHIIFMGSSLEFLKKTRLTSDYTFFSISNKRPESILIIDTLREAGIGELLVKTNVLTEDRRKEMEIRFANDSIYY